MTKVPTSRPEATVWQPASISHYPLPTPVTVWRWTLADTAVDKPPLSPDEWERADAMMPGARTRFIVHRSTLRRILAGRLDCDPAAIRFSYSRLGRPTLSKPKRNLEFNLSHSGEDAVLALSTVGAVGMDIERLRTLPDYLAIARRVWPADWVSKLTDCASDQRQWMFFNLWTRFEACQKATGSGVFSPFTDSGHSSYYLFRVRPDCIGHLCLARTATSNHAPSWLRLSDHD